MTPELSKLTLAPECHVQAAPKTHAQLPTNWMRLGDG